MNCSEIREEFLDRYLDKELTLEEIRVLKAHLESCVHCQKIFSGYKSLVNYQKTRFSYTPSFHNKQKLIRRIRQKKLLPFELVGTVAIGFLCFFGITAFIESRIINQHFERIVEKSIYSLSASASASPVFHGSYRSPNSNDVTQNMIDPDKILNLVNDED
jgi:hypothetical protein